MPRISWRSSNLFQSLCHNCWFLFPRYSDTSSPWTGTTKVVLTIKKGFQCVALFVSCALEKRAHLFCPCTSARNICPTTGCILQYKCHLGNIRGWLQGSLPGYEAERNTSCLKQVLGAHADISISGAGKGFSGTRNERRRSYFWGIKWSFGSVDLHLQELNIFVDTNHVGCKSTAVGPL